MPPLPRPSLLSSSFRLTKTPLLHRTFVSTPSRPAANITLVGRLAAEPELIPTSTGTDLVRYAIGTSHGPRDNRQTSWWKVGAYPGGNQKDTLMALGKGSLVYIEGNIVKGKYQDREGNERSSITITQRYIEVLDKRNSDDGSGGNGSEGSQSHTPE
ncbi:MAG: hypothetical protein Q9196_005771 [Gyalolechia fulgens]